MQSMDIPGQWWGVFQSPQLNSLIERSLRANPDIKAAVAGLHVAQQNARAQRATMFPTIQVEASAPRRTRPPPACNRRHGRPQEPIWPVQASPVSTSPTATSTVAQAIAARSMSRRRPRRSASSSRAYLSLRLQRGCRRHHRGVAARPGRGHQAHHRRPARDARHPEPPVGPRRHSRRRCRHPAGGAGASRSTLPPLERCWRSSATCWPP